MSTRNREFSQVRSKSNSRLNSLYSSQISLNHSRSIFDMNNNMNNKSNINTVKINLTTSRVSNNMSINCLDQSRSYNDTCIGCSNKLLASSRIIRQKQLRKQEMNFQLREIQQSCISKLSSSQDLLSLTRSNRLKQLNEHNKLQIQRKQTLQSIRKQDNQRIKFELIHSIQHQQQLQKNQRQSQIKKQNNYKMELKNQLTSINSLKSLTISRIKQQNEQAVKQNIKLLQDNMKYTQKVKQNTIKCSKVNQSQIYENIYKKLQQKQIQKQQDKKHIQAINSNFNKFTQNQPIQQSPYYLSRVTSTLHHNPQSQNNHNNNVFVEMKKAQQLKKQNKQKQEKINAQIRMNQLRKLAEQNKKNIDNKLKNMKTYVNTLTKQVKQKKKQKQQQNYYQKHYQPNEKSKVDYYTEELSNKIVKDCKNCQHKYYQPVKSRIVQIMKR